MAQRKSEESTRVQQVLKLVDKLTLEERDAVLYQLKLQDLRREIQKGIDSSERGDVYTEEAAWRRLDEHRRQFLERQNK